MLPAAIRIRGPARPSLGPMPCSGMDPGGGSLCSGVPVALLQCPSVYGAREGVCRSDKQEGQGDVSSFWFPFLTKGRNFVPSEEGNFAEPEGLAGPLRQAEWGLESFHFQGVCESQPRGKV